MLLQVCEPTVTQSGERQGGRGRRARWRGGSHRTALALQRSLSNLGIGAIRTAGHRAHSRVPRPEPLTPESRTRPEHTFLRRAGQHRRCSGAPGELQPETGPGDRTFQTGADCEQPPGAVWAAGARDQEHKNLEWKAVPGVCCSPAVALGQPVPEHPGGPHSWPASPGASQGSAGRAGARGLTGRPTA